MIKKARNLTFNPQDFIGATGKVKPVTLKYLFEFAAISNEIRTEYLNKLLKRKNSAAQKNVLLLKIIYHHIDEYKMLEWDDDRICKELSLSKGAYYFQKSYLLKGIRELYFGWAEIEKKEFTDEKKYGSREQFLIEKAKRMNDLGMRKEAKILFLQAEKIIHNYKKDFAKKNLLLLEIHYYLIIYYTDLKQYKKFYYHYKIANNIITSLSSNKFIKGNKASFDKILSYKYYFRSLKLCFNPKSNSDFKKIIENFQASRKNIDKHHQKNFYNILTLNLAVSNINIGNNKAAESLITRGLRFCDKNNMPAEALVFEGLLCLLQVKDKVINAKQGIIIMNKLFVKSKNFHYSAYWTDKLLNYCCLVASYSYNPQFPTLLFYATRYCSFAILTKGYKASFSVLYNMKLNYYIGKLMDYKIVSLDKTSENTYHSVKDIDKNFYLRLENSLTEIFSNMSYVHLDTMKKDFFIGLLAYLFFKGSDGDFMQAEKVINKIEWLNKTRKYLLPLNKRTYECLKLGIEIFQVCHYTAKSKVLDKFTGRFNELTEYLMNDPSPDITIYHHLAFIAEQTGYSELKLEISKTYQKICGKYSDYFESVEQEIESRKREPKLENENYDKPFAA